MQQMVVSRYGTIDQFMIAVSPTKQIEVADSRQDFIVGDYPTLNNVASAYGRTAPVQWLLAQIINLSEFCGVKDKLSGDQAEELAWLLKGEYSYYTVTQFLVFFHDFKMGRFGKFYGSVDPLVITSALKEFDKERVRLLAARERELEDQRLAEDAKNALNAEDVKKLLGELRQRPKSKVFDESVMRQAKGIVDNIYQVGKKILAEYRKLFKRTHGVQPEEYIEKYSDHDKKY